MSTSHVTEKLVAVVFAESFLSGAGLTLGACSAALLIVMPLTKTFMPRYYVDMIQAGRS